MARNIQAISGSRQQTVGALRRGLLGVIVWIAIAVAVPFDRLSSLDPALAPIVPWLPVAAFALALLSLVGFLRALGRLAQATLLQPGRQPGRQPGGTRAAAAPQTGLTRASKGARAAPAIRTPTVQRMR